MYPRPARACRKGFFLGSRVVTPQGLDLLIGENSQAAWALRGIVVGLDIFDDADWPHVIVVNWVHGL